MPAAPNRLPPALEQRVEVETPEQVVFDYTVAGVGSRAVAAIVDYLICFALFFGLLLLGATVGVVIAPRGGSGGATQAWVIAFYVIAQFAIQWGYYVLWEALNIHLQRETGLNRSSVVSFSEVSSGPDGRTESRITVLAMVTFRRVTMVTRPRCGPENT